MRARLKVWLEGEDGRVALSDWRVALLEAVERSGSLVAAAREMGVPHRTAWQKVHDVEERLGIKLLRTSSGGASGGSSALTDEARDLVRRYRALQAGLDDQVSQRFAAIFDR